MARFEVIDRADMNAEQARVYDAAKGSGGVVGGPYLAYIRLPRLFEAAQAQRACLRSGPLSGRERQIAYLVVARFWDARYPWSAQVNHAVEFGLEKSVINAINAREIPDLADARERVCFVVANELLANRHLSDETYRDAESTLGVDHLVSLVAIVGSFTMSCLTANAFDVEQPADAPIPLA